MSKKLSIIIIILILIVATMGILAFIMQKKTPTGESPETGFKDFSPIGSSGNTNPADGTGINNEVIDTGESVTEETTTTTPSTETISELTQLIQITSKPIAGYFTTSKSSETSKISSPLQLTIRYAEKETGNIYETKIREIPGGREEVGPQDVPRSDLEEPVGNSSQLDPEKRLTSNIIPRIEEAFFAENGNTAILRYVKNDETIPKGYTIQTFIGKIPAIEDGFLSGNFLEENITDFSLSPDTLKAFYLAENEGKVLGQIYTFATAKKTTVFTSNFTEWLSQYINSKKIGLTTKASSQLVGFSYLLDITNKSYPKVLGNINSLTTLYSPSNTLVAYNDDRLNLNLYNTTTKKTTNLGIQTIPEKCVWKKDNINLYCLVPKNPTGLQYPDAWYKGQILFTDELWKIDTKTGTTSFISARPYSQSIDGIKPTLDSTGDYLFFMNKKDYSLWTIKL
ncbi:MAG: hypothetical protein US50_C0009G0005 [Candidatus Nomurabacteria bacterium GW2011_GWB1_37_5]|uniref:Uncharacterized protein n=1 Tax=Candidatus Nomurabacteria bacterium GW2011_GWB1_37_5 TaxID=1618742 RepID=A0A0G0JFW9_9BACT|nr:MAG: hypothetical protein US50_C0009G0005 [Candidatus Nomurabacteria bacterium GW2011_GWB1_37_5]